MDEMNVVLGVGCFIVLMILGIAQFFGIPFGMSAGLLIYMGLVGVSTLVTRGFDDALFLLALVPTLTYFGFIPVLNGHFHVGAVFHSLVIIALMTVSYAVAFYRAPKY